MAGQDEYVIGTGDYRLCPMDLEKIFPPSVVKMRERRSPSKLSLKISNNTNKQAS